MKQYISVQVKKQNKQTNLLEIFMNSTFDTMCTKTKINITLSTHVNVVLK